MISFRHRSTQSEFIDSPGIPFADIRQNMKELDRINHLLGGHRICLKGLKHLILGFPRDEVIHVVEIGCGGGDNLRAIKQWAEKEKRPIALTGIDVNPECVAYARAAPGNCGVEFLQSDYCQVVFHRKPTLIFSSLFCHHFDEEELVKMLQWMRQNAVAGFFINDLHRHFLAYYSIKILTRFFSKSYLVQNDAPLSVRRGFLKKEWKNIFQLSGLQPHFIQWQWAFRWLVVFKS